MLKKYKDRHNEPQYADCLNLKMFNYQQSPLVHLSLNVNYSKASSKSLTSVLF